ncbi:MAG: N-acetylglucosaminyldiphosphoundecaprenol N-acetyl-beta-D-mannosaminyltransferase [Planctomycetota bacterium]|jgi:N-acetylglucosaminyldiphosphoundecaprenol N-acetyl-beta-D-mannosaminyltransferase
MVKSDTRTLKQVFPALTTGPKATVGQRVALPEVELRGVGIHAVSEAECVEYVLDELDQSRGGWVVTPNLDHLRRVTRDPEFRRMYREADLRVADGMILVWALSLQRTPVPERVAGSNLIQSLSAGAARRGRSVFLLGGNEGTDVGAAEELKLRFPGLEIAGTECPEYGFEKDPIHLARLARKLKDAAPDIVFVALGSPKQEHVIRLLNDEMPHTWWLGVGISFSFLTGDVERAPKWMQAAGLEWLHRLIQEPRRLFKRYVLQGMPFAAGLLSGSAIRGTLPKGRKAGRYGRRPPSALLVDDDDFALDHLEVILTTNFPELEITKRTEPVVSGDFDFYFLDNNFDGELVAASLAGEVREVHPEATVFAFSAALDVESLKGLINAGCDGACDKSEPSSWRPVIEHMRLRLAELEEGHENRNRAFGGVRHAAASIQLLLQDWNERGSQSALESGGQPAKDARSVKESGSK